MAKVKRNWIHIRPGSPGFIVSNNACDYFELGERDGADHWLEGRFDEGAGFSFSGRVFPPDGGAAVAFENFPKGDAPDGWMRQPVARGAGFELVREGVVLFGYEVLADKLCRVRVNIHAADGALVAESRDDRFEVRLGPALIGRSCAEAREAA